MTRLRPIRYYAAPLASVLFMTAVQDRFAIAQTANSNAGLQGGQDGLFDAILATPNYKTPVLPDSGIATAPGLEQAVPAPQFTLNVLAPALYNSNAQFLSSGGSQTLEGSPLVRLGWASQLFDTPIRLSAAPLVRDDRSRKPTEAAPRWGNPAIDFVAGLERNCSNISWREYTQWRVGLVLKTGWRFKITESDHEPKKPHRVSQVNALPGLRWVRVNAERLPTSRCSTFGACSRPSGAGRGSAIRPEPEQGSKRLVHVATEPCIGYYRAC